MYKLFVDFGYSTTKALQMLNSKTIGGYRTFPSAFQKTTYNPDDTGYYVKSKYPHIHVNDNLYILGQGKNDVEDKSNEALPFILGCIGVSGTYDLVISHYDSLNGSIVKNLESLIGVYKYSRNINKHFSGAFAIQPTNKWVNLTVNIRSVTVVQEGIGALAFVYNHYSVNKLEFPSRQILIVDIGAGTTDLIPVTIDETVTGYDKYEFEKPVTFKWAVDELLTICYQRVANNTRLLFSDFDQTLMRNSTETGFYGTGEDAINVTKELNEAKTEWKQKIVKILRGGDYTKRYNLLWTGGGAAILIPC